MLFWNKNVIFSILILIWECDIFSPELTYYRFRSQFTPIEFMVLYFIHTFISTSIHTYIAFNMHCILQQSLFIHIWYILSRTYVCIYSYCIQYKSIPLDIFKSFRTPTFSNMPFLLPTLFDSFLNKKMNWSASFV